VDLLIGQPVDPAKVARAVDRIDSVYQARGFFLATIKPRARTRRTGACGCSSASTRAGGSPSPGCAVNGNTRLSDKAVVAGMQTRPEGFLWFRRGKFDEEKLAGDVAERLPALYAKNGFIDFQVLRDTVIIDRARGKALVELPVREGRSTSSAHSRRATAGDSRTPTSAASTPSPGRARRSRSA
jgi:outer membrane protein insertion porin family